MCIWAHCQGISEISELLEETVDVKPKTIGRVLTVTFIRDNSMYKIQEEQLEKLGVTVSVAAICHTLKLMVCTTCQ